MARMIADLPARDALPVAVGSLTLAEASHEAITWIAPFDGRETEVDQDLVARTGCGLPEPNTFTMSGAVRAMAFGPGETLIMGPPITSLSGAAVVDQSDAWALLNLAGPDAVDVLCRVTSIDLRPTAFPVGRVACTMVGHMTAALVHLADDEFEVLVFRSMCQTAVHDLTRAMRNVAARVAL